MNWHLITDVVSLALILPGALFVFSAAVGTVRFHSTLARVHAITKPQTTGLMLMITGAIIRIVGAPDFGVHERGDVGMMLLMLLFALMTSPVTAQRLGRIARLEGLYGPTEDPNSVLTVNERPADYHPGRVDPTAR